MPRKTAAVRKLESDLADAHNQIRFLRDANFAADKKIRSLEDASKSRNEDRMLAQRLSLCNSLGQMIEATSKAVMYIVGKEQI